MMMLKENLSKILSEQGMSVRELERRSGVKPKTVQNIMQGKSENPSVNLVSKIAKELGYTMEQLISEGLSTSEHNSVTFDSELYDEIQTIVKEYIANHQTQLSFESFISAISEIYYFCCDNGMELDARFAKWWLKKHFPS